MSELSIFIDESGDFGAYDYRSPYYIVSMVFHDQSIDITEDIDKLEKQLSMIGYPNHCIHVGPIVRMEGKYKGIDYLERRRILNKMVAFTKQLDISYKNFYVEKKHIVDDVETSSKLSKQISAFIREKYQDFLKYDVVKIYYDNGQHELTKILVSVFTALLPEVQFKRILPEEYRLFQVADMFCTFELLRLKRETHTLSKGEQIFFGTSEDLKRNYLKPISKKEYV